MARRIDIMDRDGRMLGTWYGPDPLARSLADRAKAAYANGLAQRERDEREAIERASRELLRCFVTTCAATLDVDETAVAGATVDVIDNGYKFLATGQVDGLTFELAALRAEIPEMVLRGMPYIGVVLPCVQCNEDRAFWIGSLSDLGELLADQRCRQCGGSLVSTLPGHRAVPHD